MKEGRCVALMMIGEGMRSMDRRMFGMDHPALQRMQVID